MTLCILLKEALSPDLVQVRTVTYKSISFVERYNAQLKVEHLILNANGFDAILLLFNSFPSDFFYTESVQGLFGPLEISDSRQLEAISFKLGMYLGPTGHSNFQNFNNVGTISSMPKETNDRMG